MRAEKSGLLIQRSPSYQARKRPRAKQECFESFIWIYCKAGKAKDKLPQRLLQLFEHTSWLKKGHVVVWAISARFSFPSRSSNRNLRVNRNTQQRAIIGSNWTELYSQNCCLLSTSWHINSLSCGAWWCLVLLQMSSFQLRVSDKKWRNRRGEA